MWIADKWQDFELIDCSKGEKLERWGRYYLVRPDPQAIWDTPRRNSHWNDRDARYRRSETGGGSWDKGHLPENWKIRYGELTFNVKPMNFKHTGLFPEQAANWDWAMRKIRAAGRPVSVLNLFGYTGAATVACAKAGASVCHVDAAKGMVAWGKENAAASGLSDAPIRWIVDDCAKFVEREIRRGHKYDAIIMDPPSYGRGPGGEVWKLEQNLWPFVCAHQFVYYRAFRVGAQLCDGEHIHKEVRRQQRESGARPARYRQRTVSPLRSKLPLGGMKGNLPWTRSLGLKMYITPIPGTSLRASAG